MKVKIHLIQKIIYDLTNYQEVNQETWTGKQVGQDNKRDQKTAAIL